MARQLLCCVIAVIALSAAAVSAAPACRTVVAPFAPCGGLASGCKGAQCVDGVWEGHCCSPGQVCVRKTQWYRKCEDIPLNCQPYTGAACAKVVPTYGTCGGLGSDCQGCQCKDGPWDGYCCEAGAVCNKKTQFYYKCEPGPNTPVVAAAVSLAAQPAPTPTPPAKTAALPMRPVGDVPPAKLTSLPAKMEVVTPVVTPVVAVKAAPPVVPKPAPAAVTPAKPVVAPAKPVVAPAKPAVAPAKPVVAPKPAVAPASPAVAPAKPAVAPVKPAVAPAKPVVAPAKPVVAPVSKPAAGGAPVAANTTCVGTPVPLYAACGGKGTGCKAGECADAPWAGKCCVGVCRRKTEWYWKCEEASPTQLLSGCVPWKGAACGVRRVAEFAACGGKGSNCTGCDCKDAPWDGQCCPEGFKCARQTEWYWKCVK